MNDLISVIIPIYKVEPYLRRCVDSVINQTYKNLEIILVDDGSPDNCGKICDEYAKRDNRIIVIHRENGGLSAARNSGLDVCTGSYVAFVDSDDWIGRETYEVTLAKALRENADIAIFNVADVDADSGERKPHYSFGNVTALKNSDYRGIQLNMLRRGIYEMFQEKFRYLTFCFLWNKLFKRDLITGYTFKEGLKKYEDFPFVFQLLFNCDKVIMVDEFFYNYLQRGRVTLSKAYIPEINTHIYVLLDLLKQIMNSENVTDKSYWDNYYHGLSFYVCQAAKEHFSNLPFREAKRKYRQIFEYSDAEAAFKKYAPRDKRAVLVYLLLKFRLYFLLNCLMKLLFKVV